MPAQRTIATPWIAPPPPFAERRSTLRRAADRQAHQEAVLLARSLDILAEDRPAEQRLGGLLDLLARTVGAERAAVLAVGEEPRIAVAAGPGEAADEAAALAAWLDAAAPRSRVERAAATPTPVAIVSTGTRRGARSRRPLRHPHHALVRIDRAGDVTLGFAFRGPRLASRAATRLPPTLGRHAAVALAMVTAQLAEERDLRHLRARDVERRKFVSTVAHDLRTPLSAIGGYLDLLLAGRVDDPAVEREFLVRSRTMVDGLAALVGDLLELSRLESGSLNLEIARFSGREAAQQVVENLQPVALERRIRLTAGLPSRLRTVVADRRRVERILTNLVSNAIKFTPAGGEVRVELAFDGPVARYAVRDDGDGIAPQDRARIFDRFYRAPVHERVAGTGLGLSIARELARAMGGDLDVASVAGRGSAFVLVLPALATAAAEAIEAALVGALAAQELALETRPPRPAPLEVPLQVPAETPAEVPARAPLAELARSTARPTEPDRPPLSPSGNLPRNGRARRVHLVDGVLAVAD